MPEPVDEAPVLRADLRALRPKGRLFAQPGPGDWVAVGDHWLDRLRRWADLTPHDRVLEVGCGPGRSALALGTHLSDEGSYEGIDVDRRVIRWCRRNITPRWPAGRFTHVDVWNGSYNRRGKVAPEAFSFPFPDDEFDVAFATSVFTHMLEADVRRYVAELRRVLRPGGRALTTFFLVDERAVAAGADDWDIAFTRAGDGTWLLRHDAPEKAVAFDEAAVTGWFEAAGLEITAIHPGEWVRPGGGESYDYQDTIIARRPT